MKKGFSIIEILIVIGIISLLSGLSYFGFTSIRSSLDVSYAAKQVFSDVRLTQDLAKTVHYPHQIIFFRGSNHYQIINLEDDEIIKEEQVSNTVRFDGKEMFIFSSSGNPVVGGSGTLIISNIKRKIKKVIVSSNGRVRVE